MRHVWFYFYYVKFKTVSHEIESLEIETFESELFKQIYPTWLTATFQIWQKQSEV